MSPEAAPKRKGSTITSPESTASLRPDAVEPTRVEKELRENEKRLSAILAHSPNPTFLKDLEFRYLYVNREFEKALHVSQQQIQGKRDDEVFPQEQAASSQAHDFQVLQAGLPMEFEETVLHDDGPHTNIVHKFPLLDEAGKVYAIGGIATDITERKRTQEALRQGEERFRFLVGGVPNYAILALDAASTVATWNIRAERMMAHSSAAILSTYL